LSGQRKKKKKEKKRKEKKEKKEKEGGQGVIMLRSEVAYKKQKRKEYEGSFSSVG